MNDELKFDDLSLNEIATYILNEYNAIHTKIEAEKNIHTRRKLIATELYTTERSYVMSLQVISEHFITPLSSGKKRILPASEVKRIFANWKSLLICHIEILELLRERINSWGSTRLIGDVFEEAKMNSITQLYKFYINNFDRSMASLEHYRQKSSKFHKFLEEKVSSCAQGLEVGGYLIMPVQRIPRYVMLFEGLLKCTKKTHPDYVNLEKAHERFKAMADFINQSKKNSEKFSEAKKICGAIKGFPTETLLSTAGVTLIKSGTLLQRSTENPENLQRVFVVLLNNSLIIATEKKGSQQFLVELPLLKTQITMKKIGSSYGSDGSGGAGSGDGGGGGGGGGKSVIVFVPIRDETTVFVEEDAENFQLTSENDEEVEQWNNEISNAISQAKAAAKEQSQIVDPLQQEEAQIDQKRQIVEAFIQKEVQYVHQLKGLKDFLDNTMMCLEETDKKAKETKESASSTYVKKLFVDFFESVKPIIAFHVNLLALLFERMSIWQEQESRVGDIFEKNLDMAVPKYELYSLLWEEIRPRFMAAKSEMSKIFPLKFWTCVARFESDNSIKMEAFLEQISQRVPFMTIVLSDIVKSTPHDAPDYFTLDSVHRKLKNLSDKILTLKEIAHQQRQLETEKEGKEKEKEKEDGKRSKISIRKALTIGGGEKATSTKKKGT